MKKPRLVALLLAVALLAGLTTTAAKKKEDNNKVELKGDIAVSGAFALYPMAVMWAQEFQKLHPGVVVDVSAGGAGKGMADVLSGSVDIGMVSRQIHPEEISKGAWFAAVTRDAVVATVSAKNPMMKTILAHGAKKENLVNLWVTGKAKTWGDIIGSDYPYPVSVYTRSDACGAAEVWAGYLGKKQEDLKGIAVYGDPGIAQTVKGDDLGIGYNNLNFAYDLKTQKPVAGLAILPLDLNGNGTIDPEENFYGTLAQIDKAIADGKYPSPPARDLYFVSRGKPQRAVVVEFLRYVLTDGQKLVASAGYIPLSDDRIASELAKLAPEPQAPKKK